MYILNRLQKKTLLRDDLELRIEPGNKVKLYFKGVELTKSKGFSSSVLSDGKWHGLSESRIKARRVAQNKIALFIQFLRIPVIQHWIIELGPDSRINWNIEIEIEKPVRIDSVRAAVFFSKHYRVWFNAKAQEGSFPFFTENQEALYQTKELDFIGLKTGDPQMPSLLFKASGAPFTLTIQNTDLKHSSRAIEIQFEEGQELRQPGIYPYLKAGFQLYQDKTALEDILRKIRQAEENKRLEEERKRLEAEEQRRREEERKRLEAEEKRKQEENKRLEEERKRLEAEEQRRREEENKWLERERNRQEEERKRLELEESRRQAEESKQLELERKRREEENKRQEEDRKRQEEECKRLEAEEQRRQAEESKHLELERRRREEENKRQEEDRKRQEEEWKKHEERLRILQERIKKVYVEPGEATELVVLKEEYIEKDNSIYIYGDTEDLNDKISLGRGDFKKSVSKINAAVNKNKKIKIGISRFNFFKLNEIAQYCFSLINHRLDLRSVILNPLPLKRLYLNFFDYIKELNARVGSGRIEFFLKDEELLNLLYSVSSQANQYNERELLRLLGVISEHAFIGPQTIVVDTYHRCNTNCVHCWIHTPGRNLSDEIANLKMDMGLYKSIVDDAVDLLSDEIIIQGDGEPLLDDRFMEMVQYARNKGLKVIFFTNGILLDEKKAEKIIDLEIDEIYCSLPAGTDKTYAVINTKQSKEAFYKITGNLTKLISLRNKLKRSKPVLQMTHVIHDLNHHELEEMARLDVGIGADKARFYLARLDENIKFLKIKPDHVKIMKKSLERITPYLKGRNIELQDNIWFQLENYSSNTGHWSGDKFLKSGCPVGWFFCLILARGELSMCCHLRVVDYLDKKPFKDAWNSGDYDKFRTQAKHIMKNKDVTFRNGVKLYDEYCNNCDTHQVILRINELLKKYNLEQFYKGSVT